MICDEETDTPIEKEVPLSELKDVGDFFLAVSDFMHYIVILWTKTKIWAII